MIVIFILSFILMAALFLRPCPCNILGKTQAEAKEKLRRAIAENTSLDIVKAGQYTIGQWMDVWMVRELCKIKVRPLAHKTYRGYIENHIEPHIGKIPLNVLLHMLHRVLDRVGLPRLRFHDLRHTFSTLALQNGVDVKTVSGMLGHYSAGFTLDTYAHVTTQVQREAAQTMDNILSVGF